MKGAPFGLLKAPPASTLCSHSRLAWGEVTVGSLSLCSPVSWTKLAVGALRISNRKNTPASLSEAF